MQRSGIILLNIGTPKTTEVEDVREYLSRFLGDERVIEIPNPVLRFCILNVLLATRPAKSAETYKLIWDKERGSPLLYHTEDLVEKLQRHLGPMYKVAFGMAYSEPFVSDTIKQFSALGIDKILLVPMFPHYATSTVGSILENAYKISAELMCTPYLRVVPPFYNHAAYLQCMRSIITDKIENHNRRVEHLLFSFHGLPEDQCSRTDTTGTVCMKGPDCCSQMVVANRNCYRAQCFDTARLLAQQLKLKDDAWSVAFQSRLTLRDTIPWIKPYTDEAFADLARSGVKCLAVCAPSFTADCIETLEELGITGTEQFQEAGGEDLLVIPCPNSDQAWVEGLATILQEQENPDTAAERTTSELHSRTMGAVAAPFDDEIGTQAAVDKIDVAVAQL